MHRVNKNRLDRDYLWPAAIISLLLHVSFIWVLLPQGTQTASQTTELPTAVINYHTLETPDVAQRLAQWDALGGGDDAQGLASSPLQGGGPLSVDNLFLQALQRKQQELETQHRELLHRLKEQAQDMARVASDADTTPQLNPTEQGEDKLTLIQQRLAELAVHIEHSQERPRHTFVGPSTHASPFAAYIQSWQAKIEQTGTEHYPEQARGRASASLQITVYIDRSGEIQRIEIDQPADDPLFNLAARRIIHLAAPFAPFSPEMAEHTDILAITRTWHFEQGQLQTSTEKP